MKVTAHHGQSLILGTRVPHVELQIAGRTMHALRVYPDGTIRRYIDFVEVSRDHWRGEATRALTRSLPQMAPYIDDFLNHGQAACYWYVLRDALTGFNETGQFAESQPGELA